MKLSVIIPVYNEEDTILEIIEQVRESGVPELEIIVVNDCSNDRTKAKLDAANRPAAPPPAPVAPTPPATTSRPAPPPAAPSPSAGADAAQKMMEAIYALMGENRNAEAKAEFTAKRSFLSENLAPEVFQGLEFTINSLEDTEPKKKRRRR